MNLREALREMRAGREAWANVEGRRVRLSAVPEDGVAWDTVALCRWNGRAVLAVLHDKDAGARVAMVRGATTRRASWGDVLAIVVEAHPRGEDLRSEILRCGAPVTAPARIPRPGASRERPRARAGRRRGRTVGRIGR